MFFAYVGTPYSAGYSATKFALQVIELEINFILSICVIAEFVIFIIVLFSLQQGYFDSLRLELYDKNIAVTCVCPGPIKSGFVLQTQRCYVTHVHDMTSTQTTHKRTNEY